MKDGYFLVKQQGSTANYFHRIYLDFGGQFQEVEVIILHIM